MDLITRCCREFVDALKEAARLHSLGGDRDRIAGNLAHAQDLIAVITEQMRSHGLQHPGPGLPSLVQLQAKLEATELLTTPPEY